MEVILKQDITGLGTKNDTIKVKPGYGRNYLIPNGFALVANLANKKRAKENIRQASHKAAKIKEHAQEIAQKLAQLNIIIPAKVGENSKIFGSITSLQILDALKKHGVDIDRKKLSFDAHIKTLGSYEAILALHKEVSYTLKFDVVAE